uniref:Uncharacterized protein n=1 Tax=Arundo donax TaxID=35708 RepID=A0A0A9HBR9_ARUDO
MFCEQTSVILHATQSVPHRLAKSQLTRPFKRPKRLYTA